MTMPRESILLVDDEEALRWIMNRGLSMRGYNCDEAGSAEQALAKLEVNPSDLVILDINMPGRLGNEVLPEIRASFPEVAVIMASGVTDTSIIAQCIKDGAQDYLNKPFSFELNKPFSFEQVLQSVSRSLDKRRLELEIRHYLQELGEKATNQTVEIRKLFLSAIETLVNTLEAGDQYTTGHSQKVTRITLAIGQQLGLSSEELEELRWAALLHDVGKIAVDPGILNKPSELTSNEYRHIMTHAVVGPGLIKPFVSDSIVAMVSHHHDHYDGGGLDQSVAGEAIPRIPRGARVLAVADAFQAMISDRPYRRALSREDALSEIMSCSGSQFDPVVADMLLKIMRSKQD